jgi:hypothetical protein
MTFLLLVEAGGHYFAESRLVEVRIREVRKIMDAK